MSKYPSIIELIIVVDSYSRTICTLMEMNKLHLPIITLVNLNTEGKKSEQKNTFGKIPFT